MDVKIYEVKLQNYKAEHSDTYRCVMDLRKLSERISYDIASIIPRNDPTFNKPEISSKIHLYFLLLLLSLAPLYSMFSLNRCDKPVY